MSEGHGSPGRTGEGVGMSRFWIAASSAVVQGPGRQRRRGVVLSMEICPHTAAMPVEPRARSQSLIARNESAA